MVDTRHLKRRVGEGRSRQRWHVRLRIPADLRGRFGRLEFIERGLNTGDLREAQRRRHAVVAEILEQFEQARQTRTLPEIVADARQAELRRAWPIWRSVVLDHGDDVAQEAFVDLMDAEFVQVLDHEHIPSPSDDWRRRARQALQRLGAEQTTEAIEQTATALLEAYIDAAAMAIDGRELPEVARKRPLRANGEAFTATAERYIADRQRDPAAKWRNQTAAAVRATARLFADHVEDVPLPAITRQHASTFLDQLGHLNRDFARRPGAAKLTFGELLEHHSGEPSLSNRTLRRRAGELHGLFRWAPTRPPRTRIPRVPWTTRTGG